MYYEDEHDSNDEINYKDVNYTSDEGSIITDDCLSDFSVKTKSKRTTTRPHEPVVARSNRVEMSIGDVNISIVTPEESQRSSRSRSSRRTRSTSSTSFSSARGNSHEDQISESDEPVVERQVESRRSTRTRRPPERFGDLYSH